MKKTLLFASLVFFASCDIYLIEDPNGYDDRDLFVGTYNAEEYSRTTGQYYNYTITIRKSWNRHDEVLITNFYGSDLQVYGIIHNAKLTIPLQQVDGYEIEGTGTMRNDYLDMNFVARDLFARPVFADFVDVEAWLY